MLSIIGLLGLALFSAALVPIPRLDEEDSDAQGTNTNDQETGVLGNGTEAAQIDPTIVNPAGNGDDLILGSMGDDELHGYAGDDEILGGDGDDNLFGHIGHDKLNGGTGDDTLSGGGGDDYLLGDDGQDTLQGSLGNDTLVGGNGADVMHGGSGDDLVDGRDGTGARDYVNGGAGDDTLFGDAGDVLNGGTGLDFLAVEASDGPIIIEDFDPLQDTLLLFYDLAFGKPALTLETDDQGFVLLGNSQVMAYLPDAPSVDLKLVEWLPY